MTNHLRIFLTLDKKENEAQNNKIDNVIFIRNERKNNETQCNQLDQEIKLSEILNDINQIQQGKKPLSRILESCAFGIVEHNPTLDIQNLQDHEPLHFFAGETLAEHIQRREIMAKRYHQNHRSHSEPDNFGTTKLRNFYIQIQEIIDLLESFRKKNNSYSIYKALELLRPYPQLAETKLKILADLNEVNQQRINILKGLQIESLLTLEKAKLYIEKLAALYQYTCRLKEDAKNYLAAEEVFHARILASNIESIIGNIKARVMLLQETEASAISNSSSSSSIITGNEQKAQLQIESVPHPRTPALLRPNQSPPWDTHSIVIAALIIIGFLALLAACVFFPPLGVPVTVSLATTLSTVFSAVASAIATSLLIVAKYFSHLLTTIQKKWQESYRTSLLTKTLTVLGIVLAITSLVLGISLFASLIHGATTFVMGLFSSSAASSIANALELATVANTVLVSSALFITGSSLIIVACKNTFPTNRIAPMPPQSRYLTIDDAHQPQPLAHPTPAVTLTSALSTQHNLSVTDNTNLSISH